MMDSSLRILLVEDDLTLADTLRMGLGLMGIPEEDVVHVPDLAQVPQALQAHELDIALLDLGLPSTDGLQTVDAFRSIAPDLPFVVLTGSDEREVARAALQRGALDFVVKGTIDHEALTRILHNARVRFALVSELQRSNEDLSRFAFVAAHDLKMPLRNIAQMAEIVLDDVDEMDREEVRDLIGSVHRAALRASRLVDDLLRYARLGQTLEIRPFELELLVRDVWANFGAEIQGERRRVEFEVDRLPVIEGDPRQLYHVFANLFENALRYAEGDVRVRVRGRTTEEGWEIEVSDDGIGIPPEAHRQIFEPFHRLHGNTVPGTGLGLSICQRIVKGHGGRIEVRSRPGEGATFLVCLPRRGVAAASVSG